MSERYNITMIAAWLIFPACLILGGLWYIIGTDLAIKLQVWTIKVLGIGKWTPGKNVPTIYRIIGGIILIFGFFVLFEILAA